MGPLRTLAYGIFGLIAIGVATTEIQRSAMTPEEKAAETRSIQAGQIISRAEAMCQLTAEHNAHNPGSIEWLRERREFTYPKKNTALSVQPFRAKNAMGATILTGVACRFTKKGDDWELVSAKTIP